MDWYPRYPALWRSKTRSLDPYQDGCYLRLVDEYMETRQPLPDDDRALARIIGISFEDWMKLAAEVVRKFFVAQNGVLYHDRCDKILDEQDLIAKQKSEKGKKGAEVRWRKNKDLDATGIAQALPKNATGQDRTESITPVIDSPPVVPHPKTDEGNSNDAKPKRSKKPATHIADDFGPDFAGLALCTDLGLDADRVTREFIDYWKSVGKSMSDWQATFRNRARKLAEYREEREQRKVSERSGTRDVVGAAVRAAAIRSSKKL